MNRKLIYQKYDGHCAYCGAEITLREMQVDHIKPKCFSGTDEEKNLNPSCRYCNNYKCNFTVEEFRYYAKQMLNERLDYLFKSKTKMMVAVNFGTISLAKWDGMFYFEQYEMNHIE